MSLVTDFAEGAYDSVAGILGEADLRFSGSTGVAQGVWAAEKTEREFEEGGQQVGVTNTFVCPRVTFEEASGRKTPRDLLGSTVTKEGGTVYRILDVDLGVSFVTLSLVDEDQSP